MTDNQLGLELDNFITQQQHLYSTNNALTIHQLARSASTSESSSNSAATTLTRAQKAFKGKLANPSPQYLISRPR